MRIHKLLPLIGCLLLTSCNSKEKQKEVIFDKNEISKNDFYSLNEDQYAVYIMSSFCADCERLEDYYLEYIKHSDDDKFVNCYLINCSHQELNFIENKELVESQKGINNIDDTYFFCTPSIYLIKNKVLDKVLIEKEDLKNFFTISE